MIVEPVTPNAVLHVTARLRAADAEEIFATRFVDDRLALAQEVMARRELAWVAGDHEPIACLGVVPLWPGVWEAWMFATDRFRDIGLPLTRWVRRAMIPTVASAGAHRVHCHSIEGHHEAHRWLEALGAVRESSKPRFGKDGQTFHVYRWDRHV